MSIVNVASCSTIHQILPAVLWTTYTISKTYPHNLNIFMYKWYILNPLI